MKNDETKALENLSYLNEGLLYASEILGNETYAVVDLCGGAMDLKDCQVLQWVVRATLVDEIDCDVLCSHHLEPNFSIIQAFHCAIDREISLAEKAQDEREKTGAAIRASRRQADQLEAMQ